MLCGIFEGHFQKEQPLHKYNEEKEEKKGHPFYEEFKKKLEESQKPGVSRENRISLALQKMHALVNEVYAQRAENEKRRSSVSFAFINSEHVWVSKEGPSRVLLINTISKKILNKFFISDENVSQKNIYPDSSRITYSPYIEVYSRDEVEDGYVALMTQGASQFSSTNQVKECLLKTIPKRYSMPSMREKTVALLTASIYAEAWSQVSNKNKKRVSNNMVILLAQIPTPSSKYSEFVEKNHKIEEGIVSRWNMPLPTMPLTLDERKHFDQEGLPERIWKEMGPHIWVEWREVLLKKDKCKDLAIGNFNTLLYEQANGTQACYELKGEQYAQLYKANAWKTYPPNENKWEEVLKYAKELNWINEDFKELSPDQWKQLASDKMIPVVQKKSARASLLKIINTIVYKTILNISWDKLEKKINNHELFIKNSSHLIEKWIPRLKSTEIFQKVEKILDVDIMNNLN